MDSEDDHRCATNGAHAFLAVALRTQVRAVNAIEDLIRATNNTIMSYLDRVARSGRGQAHKTTPKTLVLAYLSVTHPLDYL